MLDQNQIDEILTNCREVSKENNNKKVVVYCNWLCLGEAKTKLDGNSGFIESVELDSALDKDTLLYIKSVEEEV